MQDISRCTVLLVDDAEENLDILVEILGEEVDLTVAMDGETALEIIEEERPDLILLDIEMPGMNGFDLCRRLHRSPETAAIPVIFLSGRTGEEDRATARQLGAVDFIAKPFVADKIRAIVHDVLHQAEDCQGS